MRKHFVLTFLSLTFLFHTNIGECTLWNFDFKGYITEIDIQSSVSPAPTAQDILGVSIGSRMQSSFTYNTVPIRTIISNATWDVYLMQSMPVLTFDTFYVTTGNEFAFNKPADYTYYGSGLIGSVHHEDGWISFINAYASIEFHNKMGIPYTIESFPMVLNTDNFDITFAVGSFIPFGGYHSDIPQPETAIHRVSGVIDTASVSPVPEPSTLLLMGSGLVGLVGYGRRRFKK